MAADCDGAVIAQNLDMQAFILAQIGFDPAVNSDAGQDGFDVIQGGVLCSSQTAVLAVHLPVAVIPAVVFLLNRFAAAGLGFGGSWLCGLLPVNFGGYPDPGRPASETQQASRFAFVQYFNQGEFFTDSQFFQCLTDCQIDRPCGLFNGAFHADSLLTHEQRKARCPLLSEARPKPRV